MVKITENGFIPTTQNEYFAEEVGLYRAIDSEWNLDPAEPDGLKIAHDAEVFGALDELAHQAYLSKDPNTATGRDLDIVSNITDTKRSAGSRSTVELKLTGVPNTIIDAGKRVASRTTGQRWVTEQGVTIGQDGTVFVNAYSEQIGTIEADAQTLTSIVDSVGGWMTVTNPNIATIGRNVESDGALRLSRAQQVAKTGNSQIDSIMSAIYAVQGVRRCEVYENDTGDTDDIGLPPHSMAAIVDGGEDDDIAQAIYEKRNPGTTQYIDSSNEPVEKQIKQLRSSRDATISFGRPSYKLMSVAIDIVNDGSLPQDISTTIQQSIMDFVAGDLLTSNCGFKQAGFGIGEDVPISTMMTPINKVIGPLGNAYIGQLVINGISTGSVTIGAFELSQWSTSSITVNVT